MFLGTPMSLRLLEPYLGKASGGSYPLSDNETVILYGKNSSKSTQKMKTIVADILYRALSPTREGAREAEEGRADAAAAEGAERSEREGGAGGIKDQRLKIIDQRSWSSEIKDWSSEIKSQRSEIRNKSSEIRGQRSEIIPGAHRNLHYRCPTGGAARRG